jgi:predicted amidophosphoribosyltransferase
LHGEAILLIDDVLTTGATVRECCRVLKKNGAGRITVAVLARARSY